MVDGAFLNPLAAGLLVKVIANTGRRLTTGVMDRRSSRRQELEISAWFDRYTLSDSLPILPELPDDIDQGRVSKVLNSDTVQAIVSELLAVRLCDGPARDVESLYEGFRALLAARIPDAAHLADDLFEYFDAASRDVESRLTAANSEIVRQIRQEARATRLNAILAAIERHTSSLTTRGFPQSDEDFLKRYRRQLVDHHGKIEPPDFQRRRRVPVESLYVSPTIERLVESGHPVKTNLDELEHDVDRTVLLGDPGGGKTTACHVLTYRYASTSTARTPFVVTLREFAAADPPARSVVGHIEHKLETFYQCPAPAGLVDRLLLDGSCVVIFDGLDELVETGRRIEVTAIVERFCTEYPLCPVLVTSRSIGYDQARLDDTQFVSYRIAGFEEEQVGTYVRKWFAQEPDLTAEEAERSAEDFMAESETVEDLRSNPLMLALMCILYRGEGSIPQSRPEVYEQCSTLLFRKWDDRRRIHTDLRARNLVEPTLRHLAYWVFTQDSADSAITMRRLVEQTANFFQTRGFEDHEDARSAAEEFVDFCRGRAWVFSDAGTTAQGEELFTFTHRTFLEYFAAVELASICDTPEQLARTLLPRMAKQEWEVVTQLALQVKDRTSRDGASRFYGAVLGDRRRRTDDSRENILAFLSHCISFIPLPAARVRELTRANYHLVFRPTGSSKRRYRPLGMLMGNCLDHIQVVRSELDSLLAETIEGDDAEARRIALRLAVMGWRLTLLVSSIEEIPQPWFRMVEENTTHYATRIAQESAHDLSLAIQLLGQRKMDLVELTSLHSLPLERIFATVPIFETYNYPNFIHAPFIHLIMVGYERKQESAAETEWVQRQLDQLAEIIEKTPFPLDSSNLRERYDPGIIDPLDKLATVTLTPTQLVAAGFLVLATSELLPQDADPFSIPDPSCLSPFLPYLNRRRGNTDTLPTLNVPPSHQQRFTEWANGTFDFFRPLEKS